MLYSLFQESARRAPERIAIHDGSRTITYRALDERIRDAAHNLRALGVRPETLVATCLDSRIETLVLYYAVAYLGARLVSLDTNSTASELRQVAERCRPEFVLCEARYFPTLEATLADFVPAIVLISEQSRPHNFATIFARGSSVVEDARTPFAGAFHITFTSGSTGRPKGIVVSQRALCRRVGGWIAAAGLSEADQHLCALTLSHAVGPQYGAFPALSSAATLHLMDPLQTTPLRVLRYLEQHRITTFAALPYFYQLLTAVPGGSFDLRALRTAMSVAAPLPPETARAFYAKFGVALNNSYGLSECGIVIANLERSEAAGDGAIGAALAGVEVKLLGEAENGAVVEGEVAVRSETLADDYFSSDDGALLHDGWLRTGDVARRDAAGRYHIVGRRSQFINVGGSKVMPLEVETVIRELDGIRDVAVIGVPDPLTTQKVAAFVVTEREVTLERIREHCRERIAGFKVPTYIEFRSELPMSTLGKVLKTKLSLTTARS